MMAIITKYVFSDTITILGQFPEWIKSLTLIRL